MADYLSSYTGAQVDTAVAKTIDLTSASAINSAVTKVGNMPSASDVTSATTKANSLRSATDINNVVDNAVLKPTAPISNNKIVGLDSSGNPISIYIGTNLTLENISTGVYNLVAEGGSEGTKLYKHVFTNNEIQYTVINNVATPYTIFRDQLMFAEMLMRAVHVNVYALGVSGVALASTTASTGKIFFMKNDGTFQELTYVKTSISDTVTEY